MRFREFDNGSLAVMGRLLIAVIRAYQILLRPVMPPACRFYPTCSEYAVQALRERGPVRGGMAAIGRVLRCHPWNPGGYDPLEAPRPETVPVASTRSGR